MTRFNRSLVTALGAMTVTLMPFTVLATPITPNQNLLLAGNPKAANIHYQKARIKAKSGDAKGSIAELSEAIRLNPQFAKAYMRRGNMRDNLGDPKGALQDYAQAIKINPNYSLAYYNRGLTREKLRDHRSAFKDFDQTVRLKPDFPQAYKHRGLNRLMLKDEKGAAADFRIASDLYRKTNNQRGYQQMQQILKVLGRK